MVRRYRSAPRYTVNRDKYSVENTATVTPQALTDWTSVAGDTDLAQSYQYTLNIVPASQTEGMRKVKHITLSFAGDPEAEIYYALVYVPEGYEPNYIKTPRAGKSVSLYEPNQFVMASGVLDFQGGPLRVKTPLSRNLNDGDSIQLVLAATSVVQGAQYDVAINAQYAITLQ